MTIETQTLTVNGTGDVFSYAGGSGAAIATGDFNGGNLRLEFSLDDTNYATIGRESIMFEANGFAINNIPACSMRWVLTDVEAPIAIVASVENA